MIRAMKFLNIFFTLQILGTSSLMAAPSFQETQIKRELTQIRTIGETQWGQKIAREVEKAKMKEKMEATSDKVVLND